MSATTVTPVIRVKAKPLTVHDADTFCFLLDLHGRGLTENGCTTEWVRLRDFSARELSDTASADPLNLGRVNGPAAREIASTLLNSASEVLVELLGPDTGTTTTESFGRFVGWVWVDGTSLGDLLVAQHAAVPGKFMGDPNPPPRATRRWS